MILRWFSGAAVLVVTLFATGCSDSTDVSSSADLVVRGFLFAGQPVNDIQLTTSIAIGASDTVGPPVTDAAVRLTRNGVAFSLKADSSRPGYYRYPGSDLVIATGDQVSLSVTEGDQSVSATTTVPDRPAGIAVSQDTLAVSLRTLFGSFKEVYSDDSVVVRWSGGEDDLYYTVLKNVDAAPVLIVTDTLRRFDFFSQPTSQLHYRVPVQQLRYTGLYRVLVYRVNQEYADLYRSRQQDNRTLNEPLSNITNGLGVFSAFAADSVSFIVKLQ